MDMKDHLLAAMQEQLDQFENILSFLDEAQVIHPRFDKNWSIKDVVAHLWAWQQVSMARITAASHGGGPVLPGWAAGKLDEDGDVTNERIYSLNCSRSWEDVHTTWHNGYGLLIKTSVLIPEKELLDPDRFPWMKGYSPADVLLGTYGHHQEHMEKIIASLE
jgi:hypothetical protein